MKRHFAKVVFPNSPKEYIYICDDMSVKVGESVNVMAKGVEKEVVVHEVFDADDSEIRRYNSVYRSKVAHNCKTDYDVYIEKE